MTIEIDISKRGGANIRLLPYHRDGTQGEPYFDIEVNDVDALILGSGTSKDIEPTHVTLPGTTIDNLHARVIFIYGLMCIQDLGSEHGTYLNGIRMSPSKKRSTASLVMNGDRIQFGKPKDNAPGKCQTYAELRKISPPSRDQVFQSLLSDCAICRNAIAPLQPLFVAPCSHTFHYPCSEQFLNKYPEFECPVCHISTDVRVYTSSDVNTLAKNFKRTNIK
ncbi:hypothetical protein CLU79DRAFT_836859 [Phycomyces nitens]|nr:hypothetical protein CLU79DRAFT_836859 [Phycomyces nitens]